MSLESMAVAACIKLTIVAYHFICSTWVLNWTDKSLIEYEPSMSNKNLCCRLLKRLYRISSEQVVHGRIGKMVSFFRVWVSGWRFGDCVLRLTNNDVIQYETKSNVVHLSATVFFFLLLRPIFSFFSHYST